MSVALDDLQRAAAILRESVKDKSYRVYPMGQEAGAYLRWKRGRITDATYKDVESFLDKLAREFPDLEIADFEPPVGTERLEEFMDRHWGDGAPRTFNKNLSWCKDFFKWAVLKGKLHGDPTLPIQRHKNRDVHREVFSADSHERILALGPSTEADEHFRDKVALRLLLSYGLRKGALANIQYRHFDHARKTLTVFTKGEKVRTLPIVSEGFWDDLGRHMIEVGAQPTHHLMCSTRRAWRGYNSDGTSKTDKLRFPEKSLSSHGLHDWWYRCLARAGVVSDGQTSGEKMHKARHTSGQRVLDKTGNLKAVQKLLGHASISTTADIYTDWDLNQLAQTMREVED